jgi:hypothetical protein
VRQIRIIAVMPGLTRFPPYFSNAAKKVDAGSGPA